MGTETVVLRPVIQMGYWRVEMAWRKRTHRYFGKFESQAEAEKWIEEHRWMAERQPESEFQKQDFS